MIITAIVAVAAFLTGYYMNIKYYQERIDKLRSDNAEIRRKKYEDLIRQVTFSKDEEDHNFNHTE